MIPEIDALDARPSVIRIPSQIDVPVTKRVARLIDSSAFRRLRNVSQLGLVSLVYPGATHSRFEHSLGVYKNALLFVRRLNYFPAFHDAFDVPQIEAVVVAALLHDLGHWPFCHPIEDIGLTEIPKHEAVAASIVRNELGEQLGIDWLLDTELVIRLIQNRPANESEMILCSIISGPIDIDKMDYLYRDSLHCGVPYGMNFDAPRLINSLCINGSKNAIAISSKGKTAAEMMVFARYVMFSEVYWHHAVRSATAMLQRLFFNWHSFNGKPCDESFLKIVDDRTFSEIMSHDRHGGVNDLYEGLFGARRQLYKRLLDYNSNQNPEVFAVLAHQPYERLNAYGEQLSAELSKMVGEHLGPNDVLIDAPPPGLEVQFDIEVMDGGASSQLESVSPVVNALAKKQFDDFVKRVRVFVHPRLAGKFENAEVQSCLMQIIECD